jgi:hypothetical protein
MDAKTISNGVADALDLRCKLLVAVAGGDAESHFSTLMTEYMTVTYSSR